MIEKVGRRSRGRMVREELRLSRGGRHSGEVALKLVEFELKGSQSHGRAAGVVDEEEW